MSQSVKWLLMFVGGLAACAAITLTAGYIGKRTHRKVMALADDAGLRPVPDMTEALNRKSSDLDLLRVDGDEFAFSILSSDVVAVDKQDFQGERQIKIAGRGFEANASTVTTLDGSLSLRDLYELHVFDLRSLAWSDSFETAEEYSWIAEQKKYLVSPRVKAVAYREENKFSVLLLIEEKHATVAWDLGGRGGACHFVIVDQATSGSQVIKENAIVVWRTVSTK